MPKKKFADMKPNINPSSNLFVETGIHEADGAELIHLLGVVAGEELHLSDHLIRRLLHLILH